MRHAAAFLSCSDPVCKSSLACKICDGKQLAPFLLGPCVQQLSTNQTAFLAFYTALLHTLGSSSIHTLCTLSAPHWTSFLASLSVHCLSFFILSISLFFRLGSCEPPSHWCASIGGGSMTGLVRASFPLVCIHWGWVHDAACGKWHCF